MMVKLLAELHGGAVAVASAVGEGSCFAVWLPLRPIEDASGRARAPFGAAPSADGRAYRAGCGRRFQGGGLNPHPPRG